MRAIPLTEAGQRFGALLLLRDVSELRRREQELLTKDATIREIHHRVKNNLQSVAALLRLQARRTDDEQARAALQEAERRVGTIALVHDTLSKGFDETVDFDEVADQGFRAVAEVAAYDKRIERERTGDSFGRLRAEDATSLAMILSELVQNAIEHGFPADIGGTVTVDVKRVVGVPWRSGRPDREDHRRRGRHRYGTPTRFRAGHADRPVPRAGPARDHPVVAGGTARDAGHLHGGAAPAQG